MESQENVRWRRRSRGGLDTDKYYIPLKRIIFIFAVSSIVFYCSVIAGCSFQVTLGNSNMGERGTSFLVMSVILMFLSGLCVASSTLLIIGLCVESYKLFLPWIIFVTITNIYTIAFTVINLDKHEDILDNITFDLVVASIFLLGIIVSSVAVYEMYQVSKSSCPPVPKNSNNNSPMPNNGGKRMDNERKHLGISKNDDPISSCVQSNLLTVITGRDPSSAVELQSKTSFSMDLSQTTEI